MREDARGDRGDRRRGARRTGRADHRWALLPAPRTGFMVAHRRPRGGSWRSESRGAERRRRADDRRRRRAPGGRALRRRGSPTGLAPTCSRPRADTHVDVAIRKYAKLVGSASEGACRALTAYSALPPRNASRSPSARLARGICLTRQARGERKSCVTTRASVPQIGYMRRVYTMATATTCARQAQPARSRPRSHARPPPPLSPPPGRPPEPARALFGEEVGEQRR